MSSYLNADVIYQALTFTDSSGAAVPVTGGTAGITGYLLRNGANSGQAVTITNPVGNLYMAAATVGAWTAGDSLQIVAFATVGAVTNVPSRGDVHVFQSKRISDVIDSNNRVNVGKFLDVAVAAADGSGNVPANVVNWKGSAAQAMTGDAYDRLGVPAGASIAADIATRLATSSYAVPPTAVQVRQEMDNNSNKLVNLDVALSSRSTFSGGAVASVTDKTGFKLAADGLDAVPFEAAITASANLVNDSGTQLTAINARQAGALFAAALSGQVHVSGGGVVIDAAGGTVAARITATGDGNGNRSAITLKVPN